MIVCVCHRVSDRDIEREVRHGCHSFEELQDELRVGTGCGACLECARDTFDVARACRPDAAVSAAAAAAAAPVSREIRVVPLAAVARAPQAA
jgi:bacterioferritin-associated ferredoxin